MIRSALRREPDDNLAAKATMVHVIQGEHRVSDDPGVVFTTLLGSCVAACMRDPIRGIGGMNHFRLPGQMDTERSGEAERRGVHAMELLVNTLLSRGAQRDHLEVKLFGGAKTIQGRSDVGAQNARFALDFVRREQITLVGECLMGLRGRRIQFWPTSGRARRFFFTTDEAMNERLEVVVPAASSDGSVELF